MVNFIWEFKKLNDREFEVFQQSLKKMNSIKITQKIWFELEGGGAISSQSIILGVVPTRNKLIGPLRCFAVKNSMITWTKKNGQMELQINCFVWNKIEFILWSLHYVQNCQYLSKTCLKVLAFFLSNANENNFLVWINKDNH